MQALHTQNYIRCSGATLFLLSLRRRSYRFTGESRVIPLERELAARFQVTSPQALHELLVEGRIGQRGRGTVVSRPKLIQPLSIKSYTEGVRARGRTPGRLLVTGRHPAPADLADALDVSAPDAVMHWERVLRGDEQHISGQYVSGRSSVSRN